MKCLLIIFLTGTSFCFTQKYNCLAHYDGTIRNDSISWNPSEMVEKGNILTISDKKVIIENGKYTFKILKLIETKKTTFTSKTYYALDWEKLHCYIILESYDAFSLIYFQYDNVIYGYKIEKLD